MEYPQAPVACVRPLTILTSSVVFAIAFAARWATLSSLGSDDHFSLWTAATFLKGDLPFRDFVDVGDPAYWAMSALSQAVVGYRVLGETLLGTTLVGLAFVLTFHLARRASGSFALAAVLNALALYLVTQTKLFSYTKIFLYPLGVWLCWRYIDRPTLRRFIVLAVGVVLAFGYRHDHGAYIGVGATAAVVAVHWREGARLAAQATLRFAAIVLLLLSPYFILIQVNEGVVEYFRARIQVFRTMDATARTTVWFAADPSAPAHWLKIEPPRPARAFVEWKPEVSPAERIALEQKYSLTGGRDAKTRLYEYFLTDVSRPNLTALLTDARIGERRGIATSSRYGSDAATSEMEVVATDPAPPDAPASARARVFIEWHTDVPPEERAQLERAYGLLDPTPNRNRWEYELTSVSTANIRDIVNDPQVYDTGMLDRATYRPMEESWLAWVQRSVPLFRISVAPRYWRGYNAGVALYYIVMGLPWVMLGMLLNDRVRRRRRGHMPNAPEKMFAAAAMMALADVALFRRLGYFMDHVAVTAVLGACVAGYMSSGPGAQNGIARGTRRMAAAFVVLFVTFATITYASPLRVASLAGMDDGLGGVWRKGIRTLKAFSTSPPIDEYAPRGVTGDRALIRYIYECTRPTDRVWLLSDLYTFPYYTERRVVGHIYWGTGLLTSPAYQRKTIEKVDAEEVPIVLSVGAREPLGYLDAYPLVREYVDRRYTGRYSIPEDNPRGYTFWLLTDSRRKPSGTYAQLGLPCFK